MLKGRCVEPQLVLLDHGLFVEVPSRLRLNYCRLWVAFLLNDKEAARQAAVALSGGAPHSQNPPCLESGKQETEEEEVEAHDDNDDDDDDYDNDEGDDDEEDDEEDDDDDDDDDTEDDDEDEDGDEEGGDGGDCMCAAPRH